MTPALGLPKTLRLTKRREFLSMRGPSALQARAGPFKAVVKPNSLGLNRLGVTVTRKVGKAVVRNRLKRLAREFFRLNQGKWPQGLDVLLIASAPEAESPADAKGPRGKKAKGPLKPRPRASKKIKGPGEGSAARLRAVMAKAAGLGKGVPEKDLPAKGLGG
jgi:ribonuclease P protein component